MFLCNLISTLSFSLVTLEIGTDLAAQKSLSFFRAQNKDIRAINKVILW